MVISVFNTETVPILLYHHISEDGVGNSTISVETFITYMDAICEAGYQTITFQQLREYVTNGVELPEKPIIITFDDGYLSNYEIAWPAYMERGMSTTIFVVGSSVGKNTYKETNIPNFSPFFLCAGAGNG